MDERTGGRTAADSGGAGYRIEMSVLSGQSITTAAVSIQSKDATFTSDQSFD